MPSSFRPAIMFTATTLMVTTLCSAVTMSTPAKAQEASDHCTGTLCDVYYGAVGDKAASKTGQPSQGHFWDGWIPGRSASAEPAEGSAPAVQNEGPAPSRWGNGVRVQGGGILADRPSAPCSGTACDAYHSVFGTEEPEPRATVAAAPTVAQQQRAAAIAARADKPRCTATAGDPWRCYR